MLWTQRIYIYFLEVFMPKLMFSNEPKTFINKTKQIGFGLDSPIHPQKIKKKLWEI